MLSRKFLLLPCLITAAVAISACGSSSKSSSSTTSSAATSTPATTTAASTSTSTSTSTGTSTASAATGAPIVLGSIADETGPQSGQIANTYKGVEAWADSVNASGGLNGHPVKLIVLDAGQNPATALEDAKKLVEQDHVMALVGEFSLVDAAFAKYIDSKNIPAVGGVAQEATFLSDPNFFPSGTQLVVQTVGTVALANTAHKKKIGVLYCAESPICAQLIPLTQGAAALAGVTVTAQKVSSTAPSYTAPCLSLKGQGADALFPAVAAPTVIRVVDGCAQQGYKPGVLSQTSTTTNAWLKDPNLDGALLSGANANPYDASTPAVAEFRNAMDKYFPGYTSDPAFNADDISPWAGGKLFEAAAKAAHIGPTSTGADVKKGLYALKNETLGGLTGPLNFHPGHPAFVPCYYEVQVKGGKFASLNGNKPTCLTASQTAALIKALHLG